MKRDILIIILLLVSPTVIFAQNDLSLWMNADISFKVAPKLELEVAESFRLRDNLGTIDRSETALDLSYKFCKFLKAGATYAFIYYNHPTKDWEVRNRYKVYVTGDVSLGRVDLSLREMFQSTYRVGIEETATRANPKFVLRSKLTVTYDIKGSKFTPFVSAEYYNNLNDPVENELVKTRYSMGTKYKINKKSSIELNYRYITEKDEDDLEGSNILSVGYSYKF